MADWREESNTRVEMNEFGELYFAGDAPGPVIHRTPEELGLPRVIPAQPPPLKLINADWQPPAPSTVRTRRMKRDPVRRGRYRVAPREIQGVEVVLPPHAVMGGDD